MNTRVLRAAILVSVAAFSAASPLVATQSGDKVTELWQSPDDIASRNLYSGPGGAELAPKPDATFTWVATDTDGYSPGYDLRAADGRHWSAKLGPEAQTEVVTSRILWAIGYHQPPTYYMSSWQLSGGPGGRQAAARFRTDFDGAKVTGEWSWSKNDFLNTQPFRGLIVANIVLNSWDWKTSNNKIYEYANGTRRYVVRDLGASLGKTSSSKLLWTIPMRGLGQGTRNDIAGFEAQGFIKRAGESEVEFDFETVYGSVVDLVRPADVRWAAELLNRLTDSQWDDAFRAADYTPDIRARFIKKIKSKIAEGLAVS
jgi:hypothetical protein